MTQPHLFDIVDADRRAAAARAWTPEAPPDLSRHRDVYLDGETTGLKWVHGQDRPVGWAVHTPADGRSYYLPFAHRGGGNLDEAVVKEWARHELRGKRIRNLNTRFDVHVSREWGVDLAAQDNEFYDAAHDAALLDDHRQRFNLQELSEDLLGVAGKVKLDVSSGAHIADLPAGEVAAYAMRDVELVRQLRDWAAPRIAAEGLERVAALEHALIPVVCEMEKNGAPIDVGLLHDWRDAAKNKIETLTWSLYRETGVLFDPSKSSTWQRLFRAAGLAAPGRTEKGAPSFADIHVRNVDHPFVRDARRIVKLTGLVDKYLDPYAAQVDSDGILRYALNQLRTNHDESLGLKGTVSGRFSSSALWDGYGINIQQVTTPDKQIEAAAFHGVDELRDWIVRRLFKPGEGAWLSADAKQIEYRFFAHYSGAPDILAAYAGPPVMDDDGVWISGPETDYHAVVQRKLVDYSELIRILLAENNKKRARKLTKNTNFALMFGAGIGKIAEMLGMDRGAAARFVDDYKSAFPATDALLRKATKRAELRGYVMTALGRRCRFPGKERTHKAVNAVIQGSAADYNKLMLLELYRNRALLDIVMRFTVHDEFDGDARDPGKLPMIEELFAQQLLDLRVPILWDVKLGRSWDVEREPWEERRAA